MTNRRKAKTERQNASKIDRSKGSLHALLSDNLMSHRTRYGELSILKLSKEIGISGTYLYRCLEPGATISTKVASKICAASDGALELKDFIPFFKS